jgi:AcrR family transcriptional regulator
MTTLRQRHTEVTRDAIFDALASIIADEGIAGFSVQAVADAAGVSHRTVYRHFPTREALLEGLGAWLGTQFVARLNFSDFGQVSLDDLGRVTEVGFRVFDDNADWVRAYVMLLIGARITLPSRLARSAQFQAMVGAAGEHLHPDDVAALGVLLRTMSSTVTWHHMREHSDASDDACARAVRWAIDTLAREIACGNGPIQATRGANDETAV